MMKTNQFEQCLEVPDSSGSKTVKRSMFSIEEEERYTSSEVDSDELVTIEERLTDEDNFKNTTT